MLPKDVKLRRDAVLVKPIEISQIGSIMLPESSKMTNTKKGEVVAVGPGGFTEAGEQLPMDLEPGDVVLYVEYRGEPIRLDGADYLLFMESDIFGTQGRAS